MMPNKNQRMLGEVVGLIVLVITLMTGTFAVLEFFLPPSVVQPIGALVIGLILTVTLVLTDKLDRGTALATWLTVSIVLIIVHLIVSRPATVVGAVVDSSGSPVAGLTLALTDSSGVNHRAVTDGNGEFEIKNIPEDKFTITANGELLFSGRVPSGWKRIVDNTVDVGILVHRPGQTTTQPTSDVNVSCDQEESGATIDGTLVPVSHWKSDCAYHEPSNLYGKTVKLTTWGIIIEYADHNIVRASIVPPYVPVIVPRSSSLLAGYQSKDGAEAAYRNANPTAPAPITTP